MLSLSLISSGLWLTPKRVYWYPKVFFSISLALWVAYVLTGHGGLDFRGHPIGTDFSSFWAASSLVLSGHAGDAYDQIKHYEAQQAHFGEGVQYYAWFYPPSALLLVAPLGILPYLPALIIWLAATGAAYVATVYRFIQRADAIIPILCFPAVLINTIHGQNAFLSTAIVGTGLLMSDRRPFAAGLILGTLCFKPQLAPMLAVVVVARMNWKMALGAALSVCSLLISATLIFGLEVWQQFASIVPVSAMWLEYGVMGFAKMQSAFATVRLLGGGIGLAYSIQALVTISIAVLLFMIWRTSASPRLRAGATGAAILLGTPFLLDYDLVLLSLPIAALAAEGLENGFRPYERTALACAWLLPLMARPAGFAHIPLSPEVVACLLVLIWRRTTKKEPKAVKPPGDAVPANQSQATSTSATTRHC
ncbi:alpha-1,2-mannosyltransferase [Bradyrhizobium japonicum]